MRRLEKMDRGIVNRRPGVNPTVDAEALKYLMVEMITEAKVDVFLHCWGVDAIMDGNAVRGAVFESKSGRQAIVAKMVVDASGDGDVFGAAGAEHENRPYHIGLPYRLGNLDKIDRVKAKDGQAADRSGRPDADPRRQLGQHARPRRHQRPGRGRTDAAGTGPSPADLEDGRERSARRPATNKST